MTAVSNMYSVRRATLILIGLCSLTLLTGTCHKKIDPRPFCSVGASEFDALVDMWNALRTDRTPEAHLLHHEGRGNATAARVLGRGACALGAVTERMSGRDFSRLKETFGHEPGVFAVALEALVIIVPTASPLHRLSTEQVRILFETAPKRMDELEPSTRSDLALQPVGVNSASDRYRWFKTMLLGGRNVASRVREVPGPLQLADVVAETPGGVGYARPAELGKGVRPLDITSGGKVLSFSEEAAGAGTYPFSRYFYVYLPPPGSPAVTGEVLDFLTVALGERGQRALRPLGLYPVPPVERARNAKLLARYRAHLPSR